MTSDHTYYLAKHRTIIGPRKDELGHLLVGCYLGILPANIESSIYDGCGIHTNEKGEEVIIVVWGKSNVVRLNNFNEKKQLSF